MSPRIPETLQPLHLPPLPSLLPHPPLPHTHTHRARGEGTEFHAPLTEIKQKVHPHPWNAIVATSLKSVKEAEEEENGEGEARNRRTTLKFYFLQCLYANQISPVMSLDKPTG